MMPTRGRSTTMAFSIGIFFVALLATCWADKYHSRNTAARSTSRVISEGILKRKQSILCILFHNYNPWQFLTGRDHWIDLAQQLLKDEVNKRPINSKAKNVIFFLGDGIKIKNYLAKRDLLDNIISTGMSIPTVTAARIYKGQKEGRPGEEEQLSFDKFPYTALSRVKIINQKIWT